MNAYSVNLIGEDTGSIKEEKTLEDWKITLIAEILKAFDRDTQILILNSLIKN